MQVELELKNAFFDRAVVIQSMDKVKLKAFHIAAARVRKRAMQSMRRQKKPSKKGNPPAFHDSAMVTLRYILYGWDRRNDSIIIGPVKHNSKANNPMVPPLHEFGLTAPVNEWKRIPIGTKTKKRIKRSKKLQEQFDVWLNGGSKRVNLSPDLLFTYEFRKRMVKYPKRPFMRPALLAEQKKLPHLWRGALRPARNARTR